MPAIATIKIEGIFINENYRDTKIAFLNDEFSFTTTFHSFTSDYQIEGDTIIIKNISLGEIKYKIMSDSILACNGHWMFKGLYNKIQ